MAKTGPKPKQLDAKLIERLARIHCTTEEIAAVCGVSKDTIERRYREALDLGKARGRACLRRMQYRVAQAQYKACLTGESSQYGMLVWLGKQLLGQKEQVAQQLEGQLTLNDATAIGEQFLADLASHAATVNQKKAPESLH